MNISQSTRRTGVAVALGAALLWFAPSALAGWHLGVGISVPAVTVGSCWRCGYRIARPVYYPPAPVYYVPPPVYYVPRPVYYYGYGYYGARRWHSQRHYSRHHHRGYHDGYRGRRGYYHDDDD